MAAAVLVVLVALGIVSALSGGHDADPSGKSRTATTASPGASHTPTIAGPKPPPEDSELVLGDASAPVEIVEFADFQCPYCGQFARSQQRKLVKKYVETGVARLVWRDFPYFGGQSVGAAHAARAAARQHKFWPYHDALYAQPTKPGAGRFDDAFLRDTARKLGLDVAKFDADRHAEKIKARVDRDFEFGQGLGIPGTPAFLINGTPMIGAQPLATFEKKIEKARDAAGGAP